MSVDFLCEKLDLSRGFTAQDNSSDEGYTIVYEVYGGIDKRTVQEAVEEYFPRISCGHEYDCCGCYFRATTFVAEMYPGCYLIIDNWGRNI